jgi:hypothetical protein
VLNLRAQFRKEAARTIDAVRCAAGDNCSLFMSEACRNFLKVHARVTAQATDARGLGLTWLCDRAECRARLELRRYPGVTRVTGGHSNVRGRCPISLAHAEGRGWGGGFAQVNMSTLPGPPHANRQTQKVGGNAHSGEHPKPPPAETATVTVLAFPAMLRRCAAIMPFSF